MNLGIGIIAGLVCMVSWGAADFFAALSSRKVGHFITLFWVYVLSLILNSAYVLFNFQNVNLTPQAIFILALVGLLQAIALMFFYKGLEIGLVSVVSPIASSYSLIVVFLGIFLLQESLTSLQLAAIFLIFIGVILVSININEIKRAGKKIFQKGVKEASISFFAWGFSYFLLTPIVRNYGWVITTDLDFFFIVLFLLIWGIIARERFFTSEKTVFLPILSDGILTVIGYLAYSFGLLYSFVSIVTPVSTIFPVVTIILARIFFKEKLVWNQVLGIAGVIGGLILLGI